MSAQTFTDSTSPGEIPAIEPGKWTEQLDACLESANRFWVRMDEEGLPDWPRPEGETTEQRNLAYRPWLYELVNFISTSTRAHLLIRLAQVAPEHAEAIAEELSDFLEAGDAYPEWVYDWAEKRGLDVEAMQADALEKFRAEKAAQA